MNERMRESLSALMDDVANELELERVLSQLSSDPELRQTWLRNNLAKHAVHGEQLAHRDWDVSTRVQSALANSPVASSPVSITRFKQRLMRPLISVGVAASVTLTVVIGGQQLAGLGANTFESDRSVAADASPVGLLNSLGAMPLQAGFGMQAIPVMQPATPTTYETLAQQRLRRYMQEHAEQAALNSPQGLIPFARVPEIRE
jgi:sigma-E factor negative regulatory protein RseA